MAKPYLIFKAHTGFYYAQIRLADGSLSNNKSTGCRKAHGIGSLNWAARRKDNCGERGNGRGKINLRITLVFVLNISVFFIARLQILYSSCFQKNIVKS